MAKDKSEVLVLLKVALEIDNLAAKQEEIISKVRGILDPTVKKDMEQITEAVNRLQSTLNSIYYNNIGE